MVGHNGARDTGSSGNLPQWRAGMRTRGGRVTHTIARSGWIVFGGAGLALGVVVAVVFGVIDAAEYSFSGAFLGGLVLFTPICAAIFALLGLAIQFGTRAWLRTAPPVVSREERNAQASAAQVDEAGLRTASRWASHYEHCLRSVTGFHDIVRGLPAGAPGEWFDDIGHTLDRQLAEALRLAKLGDSLEGSSDPAAQPSTTAYRIDESLRKAAEAFTLTTEQAASIALDLHGEADFTRIRSQLDMLRQQAPQLHER